MNHFDNPMPLYAAPETSTTTSPFFSNNNSLLSSSSNASISTPQDFRPRSYPPAFAGLNYPSPTSSFNSFQTMPGLQWTPNFGQPSSPVDDLPQFSKYVWSVPAFQTAASPAFELPWTQYGTTTPNPWATTPQASHQPVIPFVPTLEPAAPINSLNVDVSPIDDEDDDDSFDSDETSFFNADTATVENKSNNNQSDLPLDNDQLIASFTVVRPLAKRKSAALITPLASSVESPITSPPKVRRVKAGDKGVKKVLASKKKTSPPAKAATTRRRSSLSKPAKAALLPPTPVSPSKKDRKPRAPPVTATPTTACFTKASSALNMKTSRKTPARLTDTKKIKSSARAWPDPPSPSDSGSSGLGSHYAPSSAPDRESEKDEYCPSPRLSAKRTTKRSPKSTLRVSGKSVVQSQSSKPKVKKIYGEGRQMQNQRAQAKYRCKIKDRALMTWNYVVSIDKMLQELKGTTKLHKALAALRARFVGNLTNLDSASANLFLKHQSLQ